VLGRHFKRSEAEFQLEEHTPFNIFIRENCPAATA
jgi:LacI family transcriptional regulator